MTLCSSTAETYLTVWGQTLDRRDLTTQQIAYLRALPDPIPDVSWVWHEMNRVWREIGLDNTRPLRDQSDKVAEFYSHPIWLVNGLFTAADPQSSGHRVAIAQYLTSLHAKTIADYGGGFGELALTIARHNLASHITVVEPYPTKVGLRRLAGVDNVSLQADLSQGPYEVVLAQDVLEHVDDPIGLAHQLAQSVRMDGYLILANCFHPMIDCHLPPTFHLRYTFDHVMRIMGLHYNGKVPGAPNARIFKVSATPSLPRARMAESISKAGLGQTFNLLGDLLWRARQALPKTI